VCLQLHARGVAAAATAALRTPQLPEELYRHAAGVLAHLARSSDVRKSLNSASPSAADALLPLLLQYAERGTDPEGVLEPVVTALALLCDVDDQVRTAVVHGGGVEAAIGQLQDGSIVVLSSDTARGALRLTRALLTSQVRTDKPRRLMTESPTGRRWWGGDGYGSGTYNPS
jgi:hypothetical protein